MEADFSIQNLNLELAENLGRHKTNGFSSANTLVVRRGAPFRISVQFKERPFNPRTDSLRIKVTLGRLYAVMPVTFSKKTASSSWNAYIEPNNANFQKLSIFVFPPASASVGSYKLQLSAFTQDGQRSDVVGNFIVLCNPWCAEDSVYIPFEDQREEYVLSDSGLLFMGTPMNLLSRPWSFDLYEPGVLEACLDLLKVSPQHKKNRKRDYLNRASPVYISRIVSAMINSEDDRGVLKGNWTADFKQGVSPTKWTGSEEILSLWAKSGYSPVKYGQCWVFAAVMCTVMRVLGIPCRVVTNFNSAHDTNANLVIEEYYSETGQKLNRSRDSIWNYHVWVECWMSRGDLGPEMDGWQVLDPTPQERSGGVFCCGPAPVKAIKNQRTDMIYDIPFVYAAVNADVHMIILSSQNQVVGFSKDTEKVGSLICTKAIGHPRVQNITGDYKYIKSPTSTLSSRSSTISDRSTLHRAAVSKGVTVFLDLNKSPVAGEPVIFTVKVGNTQSTPKTLKVHLNAQAKEYNHSPTETFWEKHGVLQLAPMEVKVFQEQILPAEYEPVVGDDLINLAVVLEDMATHKWVLASEEFNIANPELIIQVADENSIVPNREVTALVAFTNPFPHPVKGVLTVSGAGLFAGKQHFRMPSLSPGARASQSITFVPSMAGVKMLQASLSLSDSNITIRGFKMIPVNSI
ncbi:protein-glutamine gamma-glutamyltransferase 5-like [Fundulus heteroclitus]|uniref:protein-glutamine gamma-glutamyltransferase 5-like n=2 Tax=Fundulus heteroclitus TaxID=8078 RepID=UPI00165C73F7|nr:protein-glutamine gamma-glutamyltransferase 5-like [Fundulus heteroclitus]